MAMEYTKANSCELRLDPALESPPLQYVNADIRNNDHKSICTDDDLADDIEFIEDLNIGETSRRYIIVPPQMPIFQPNQAPPMQPDQVHQHNRSQQFPELHLSHIGAAIAGVFLGMIIMKILK